MTNLVRNGIFIGVFFLAWMYLYVPNPYASFIAINDQSETASNDLLFLWIPLILGAMAYVVHAGRWFVRICLALFPPILLLAAVFLLGLAGVMSNESAGWTLISLMLPMRAFIIALAVTTLMVEVVTRLRTRGQVKGTRVT